MSSLIDLTGREYGFLKVLRQCESTRAGNSRWLCRCELCGRKFRLERKSIVKRKWPDCGCVSRKKVKKKVPEKKGGDTLCWECDLVGKRLCEWDRELKPVPGWEAEETRLWVSHQGKYEKSYRVINCPKKK